MPSVVMNMASSALARECLYDDPRILTFSAGIIALNKHTSKTRETKAKGVVAEMHSALAQTYTALGQSAAARDAFLNAYRLRIELADTDPSNQFYASQVMMSRLSLQYLDITHGSTEELHRARGFIGLGTASSSSSRS